MLYLALKALHLMAAMVWIGVVVTLALQNFRLRRSPDRALLKGFAREAQFLGSRVVGPAAGLTLLAGLATAGAGHLGFPRWVLWGLTIWVLVIVVGGVMIPRAGIRLARRLEEGASDAEIGTLQRGIGRLQVVALLLLAMVVVVMVFKPV